VSDAAAAQLRRILALVPELADDREHGIESLARRLATDRDTLLADLRSLTDRFDDPAGFVEEGVSVFVEHERVSLGSSHFRRPMRVTGAELRALELGLTMLEAERPPEERRAIGRARERLRQVLAKLARGPEVIADNVHASLGDAGAAQLGVLSAALRTSRKVRLRYRRADAESATERVVCPYALVVASGAWYTIALCERSEGVRVFRLDRVEHAESLADAYAVPSTFSVSDVVRDGRVFMTGTPATMTVRYSPRIARWIAEREGVEPAADGTLTIEHPLADAGWAVRHVLQYGPDAEVLQPASLRRDLAQSLGALAAARDGAVAETSA
jgi:proteasome accessory factor C